MRDPETESRIAELRVRIDEVDRGLVHMLNERARIVQELASFKSESGVPIFDPKREEEILRKIAEENPGPIYDASVREIFELIMHRIRDLEVQREEFSE